MKVRVVYFIVIILFSNAVFSQEEKEQDSTIWMKDYVIYKGDTLEIKLPEVTVLGKLNFKTNYDKRYYYWYRKKTLKAYPYAKMASERLDSLNKRLQKIDSKRQKRKYIKRVQKYLEDELTDQLKNLTRTEGRILLKLVHRQTGRTAYDLIKGLRSSWKAFWYNTTANLFSLSLKSTYDPVHKMEDFMIEDILQRAFNDGILEEQKTQIDFNYLDAPFEKINVESFAKKKKKKKK